MMPDRANGLSRISERVLVRIGAQEGACPSSEFEAKIVAETENSFAIRRHWWSSKLWVRKDSSIIRLERIMR